MRPRALLVAGALSSTLAGSARADAPVIEHQPSPCTIPNRAIALCATITDDSQVQKARIYFRPEGEKFWYVTEMAFTGFNFCGTLPGPREGKLPVLEYYIQGVDDEYEAQRTSTYRLAVQGEDQCGFPPLEKDAEKAGHIVVTATDKKLGTKLKDAFDPTGVTFVPVR